MIAEELLLPPAEDKGTVMMRGMSPILAVSDDLEEQLT